MSQSQNTHGVKLTRISSGKYLHEQTGLEIERSHIGSGLVGAGGGWDVWTIAPADEEGGWSVDARTLDEARGMIGFFMDTMLTRMQVMAMIAREWADEHDMAPMDDSEFRMAYAPLRTRLERRVQGDS